MNDDSDLLSSGQAEAIFQRSGASEADRKLLLANVECALLAARDVHRRHLRRRPWQAGISPLLRSRLVRVTKLSNELNLAVQLLVGHPEELSEWFWSHALNSDNDRDDDFLVSDLQSRLEALEHFSKKLAAPRQKNTANRPRGSVDNPALRWLVLALYERMSVFDVKLTLWHDRASDCWKGTLLHILEVLHEVVPEIVPRRLPFRTIQRLVSQAKRCDKKPPSPPRLEVMPRTD